MKLRFGNIKCITLKRNIEYIQEFGIKILYDELSKQQYINLNLVWHTVSFYWSRK